MPNLSHKRLFSIERGPQLTDIHECWCWESIREFDRNLEQWVPERGTFFPLGELFYFSKNRTSYTMRERLRFGFRELA